MASKTEVETELAQSLLCSFPILSSICVPVTHQVIQSSHQGFKLLLPNAALVQGAKGGASPAYSANRVGFMDGAVQQD